MTLIDPPETPSAEEDFARIRRDLVRAVGRVCPPWLSDRAEDLAQLAAMRLLEIRRRSEGKAEQSASYLRKVAYSVVIDEIRKLRRRRETSLEAESAEGETFGEPAEPAPTPEVRSAGRQIGDAIRDCLGRLVRPRRLAATLNLQGHSVPEIGRLMGWSAKKAENLVYRGLADLRECLTSKGVRP